MTDLKVANDETYCLDFDLCKGDNYVSSWMSFIEVLKVIENILPVIHVACDIFQWEGFFLKLQMMLYDTLNENLVIENQK